MIVVVTGASGFIGWNLTRRLLGDGHEVRCLVRPGGKETPPGAPRFVVRFDSPESLLTTDALGGADAVVHLAGATRAVSPAAFFAANVTPTRHILGAITARRLHPRFVYVSSLAAAGPASARDRPVDEDDVPRPVEAYGRSKLDGERVVESFGDRVSATIVRPCAVFGPRDRGFLTLFRFAERGLIVYPGTADHWLSLLYVEDLVDGLSRIARDDRTAHRRYFLAAGEPVSWRQLGEGIASAVGRPVRHLNVASSVVQTAAVAAEWFGRFTGTVPLANRSRAALARQRFWVCSAARARADIGLRAHSLPGALRDTYLWYRESGWLRGSRRADSAVA